MSYSNSNLEIIWFRLYEPKNTLVFCFSFFHFDDFLTTFAKDLIQKPPVFITNIKSTHNFLHFHKNLRSRKFWRRNDGPLKILWKLHGNACSLQISVKFRKFETCIYIEFRLSSCCHSKNEVSKIFEFDLTDRLKC